MQHTIGLSSQIDKPLAVVQAYLSDPMTISDWWPDGMHISNVREQNGLKLWEFRQRRQGKSYQGDARQLQNSSQTLVILSSTRQGFKYTLSFSFRAVKESTGLGLDLNYDLALANEEVQEESIKQFNQAEAQSILQNLVGKLVCLPDQASFRGSGISELVKE